MTGAVGDAIVWLIWIATAGMIVWGTGSMISRCVRRYQERPARRLMALVVAVVTICLLALVGAVLTYEFLLYSSVYDWNPDYNSIDRCLDRGGRWLYESRECEGA